MNHTKNYHLPQWSEDDLILMEDFNQMNRDIENGITSTASAAEEAKALAENARQNAVSAFRPGYLPYVVGSYYGNGENITIELGFRPSFLIISGASATYSIDSAALGHYNIFTGGHIMTAFVAFTATGFVVRKMSGNEHPKLTESRTYDYIAFR